MATTARWLWALGIMALLTAAWDAVAQDNIAQDNGRASLRRFAPGQQVPRLLTLTITTPVAGDMVFGAPLEVRGVLSQPLQFLEEVECNGIQAVGPGADFSCGVELVPGDNEIVVVARDRRGNQASDTLHVIFVALPTVEILAPAAGSTVRAGPVTLEATVDDPDAVIQINGVEINSGTAGSGGNITQSVDLREGANLITVAARNEAGGVATASVEVILDPTPPRVVIDSPPDGFVTHTPALAVTGMVLDRTVGTVNEAQAQVTVNGTAARLSNRSFLADGIVLQSGENLIEAIAIDAAGNTATTRITVVYQDTPAGDILRPVAGNNQQAPIGTTLSTPLVVELLNAAGDPVAQRAVLFRVEENNGRLLGSAAADGRSLVVQTDGQGRAQAQLTLGSHAGAGRNRVAVRATGVEHGMFFCATATPAVPAKLSLDAGNHQTCAVGVPLPDPLAVVVTDAGHNRLANVAVLFSVTEGGGHFNGHSTLDVLTDSDGRALALLTFGPEAGINNNVVEANFTDNDDLPVRFVTSGQVPQDPEQTQVSGVVLDNSGLPIAGVTLRLDGTDLETRSDDQGLFSLQPAPVGRIHLLADGSTAQRPGTWPNLEYELVTIAGQDNSIGGPIYLLPLDTPNALSVSPTEGGTLTLPQMPGFALEIEPGAATFPDGSRAGQVSVTLVHADKVPMAPNFGQQPRLVVTIQPAGVTFDPPARLSLPNVDGLAPGEKTELYSFDHDLGRFVGIGTGAASDDGMVIRSDPGVGVVKGGWHCGGNPQTTGGAERATIKLVRFCDPQCVAINAGPQAFMVAQGRTFYVEARGKPDPGQYEWRVDGDAVQLTGGGQIGQFRSAHAGKSTINVRYICKSGAPSPWVSLVVEVPGVHISIAENTSPEDVLFLNDDFLEGKSAPDLTDAAPLNQDRNAIVFDRLRRIRVTIQPGDADALAGSNITLIKSGLGGLRVLAIKALEWTQVPIGAPPDSLSLTPLPDNLRDNFFLPNGTYTPFDLYVEGTSPGSAVLELRFTKNGQTSADTLDLKIFDVDLLLGAQAENDLSLNDDWVGADGHKIFNFLLVNGPPNTSVKLLATFLSEVDPQDPESVDEGTIRFIQPRRQITTNGVGRAVQPFEISGNHVSSFPEDVMVRVMSGRALLAAQETITVLQTKMPAETDGQGVVPLNPAIVNSVEGQTTGNLFGTATREVDPDKPETHRSISDAGFTLPAGLESSKKISPDKIEVLWARQINGQVVDSIQDPGLLTPTLTQDQTRASSSFRSTSFRMQDTSLNSTLAAETRVHYFIGHPTSKRNEIPAIQVNHLASVEAKVLPHLTYPVVVHLLVGPTLNSSFTLASILPVMAAANSILSQAGISLNVSSVLTHTFTTDALLNVDTPTVGFGEAATVTALTAAANAIDIYFTNKVLDSDGDDLNGLTILFSQQSSLFGRTPGILIGANGIGFGSGIRKAGLMPRTIAHEIGHYLLDTTGHAPNNQLWNLMLSGGIDNSDRKRDLTEQQADDIRKSNVTPTNTR